MTKKWIVFLCMVLSVVLLQSMSGQALHIDDDGIVWIEVDGKQIKLQDYLVPVGTIDAFAGDNRTVPAGWLICDGRKIDKMINPEYADLVDLFWIIADNNTSHPYISGCSVNEARLPDLRGRFLRGMNNPYTATGDAARDPDASDRTNEEGMVVGGTAGSVQEDAMQRITGVFGRSAVQDHATGPFRQSFIASLLKGTSSGFPTYTVDFDSKNSDTPSLAKTSDYETRGKNLYVAYMIKY